MDGGKSHDLNPRQRGLFGEGAGELHPLQVTADKVQPYLELFLSLSFFSAKGQLGLTLQNKFNLIPELSFFPGLYDIFPPKTTWQTYPAHLSPLPSIFTTTLRGGLGGEGGSGPESPRQLAVSWFA